MTKKKQSIWVRIRQILPLIVIGAVCSGVSYWVLFNHYSNFSFVGGNDLVYRIESKLLDWRVLKRGAQKPTGKVGILAIDEKSLTSFGNYPFQRKYYAQAFDNLKKLGVEWIGFDVIFAEPQGARVTDAEQQINLLKKILSDPRPAASPSAQRQVSLIDKMMSQSPSDEILADAIRRFENIVLGYFFFNFEAEAKANLGDGERFAGLEPMLGSEVLVDMPEGKTLADYPQVNKAYGLRSNYQLINESSAWHGYFGNDADDDAINRWVTLVSNVDGKLLPSLGLLTAARYLKRQIVVFFDDVGIESISLISEDDNSELKIPVDPRGVGRILVNHRGPGRVTFHHYSLADAYHNSFTEEEKKNLKGSLLLMGATATGTNDIRPNPFDPSIDGVENHAAVMDNILAGDFFKRPVDIYTSELMIVVGIGLLFTPLMIWAKAAFSGIAVILFLVGYYYVDQLFWFSRGTWAFMAVPAFQIVSMFLLSTMYKYLTEEREKKKVKGVFQAYLSPDVIEQVLADGDLSLGGKRMEITLYFSDVRGFTTISESLTPEKLVEFMNTYFTPMTAAILKSGGTLDKYIGDAIMAFWGAPIPLPDQADRAAKVAITHLWELDKLQKDLPAKGFPKPDIGIGLNSGPASVGNMGSTERLAYTALGDHVNLAARLEGLTKDYGIKILMSEFTRAKLTDGLFFSRDLDDIRVKGKNQPVKVFELMRPDMLKGNQNLIKNLIGEFELGRKAYLARDWVASEKHFGECVKINPGDGPATLYIERIAEYKAEPPTDAWDGVYTFKHK